MRKKLKGFPGDKGVHHAESREEKDEKNYDSEHVGLTQEQAFRAFIGWLIGFVALAYILFNNL